MFITFRTINELKGRIQDSIKGGWGGGANKLLKCMWCMNLHAKAQQFFPCYELLHCTKYHDMLHSIY